MFGDKGVCCSRVITHEAKAELSSHSLLVSFPAIWDVKRVSISLVSFLGEVRGAAGTLSRWCQCVCLSLMGSMPLVLEDTFNVNLWKHQLVSAVIPTFINTPRNLM